jgi:hypothetical protein
MADDLKPPVADPASKPFAPFAPFGASPVAEPEKDPDSPAARLRAFEDEVFGEDCVRINGRIERGSGSPFAAMSPERKAEYAALEKLVEAEQRVDDANAALMTAQMDRDKAVADVDAAVEAVEQAKVRADEQAAAAEAKAAARASKQPAKV